jgi:hypothetical protein
MDIFESLFTEAKEFDMTTLERDHWYALIKKEQDAVGIHFDLENNDSIGDPKEIELDIKYPSGDPVKVLVQLYSAGGDWETAVGYFKGQLSLANMFFIYIPGPEVNVNLVKSKKGYAPLDNNDVEDPVMVSEIERKLWDALKEDLAVRFAAEAGDEWEPDYDKMRAYSKAK